MTSFESDPITEIHPQEIRFLREQDGRIERLLKQELIVLFKEAKEVDEAYLVKCGFGGSLPDGALLAIRSSSGAEMNLVERIQAVFASIFAKREHLDILLLDSGQQRQVSSVCLPFYQKR